MPDAARARLNTTKAIPAAMRGVVRTLDVLRALNDKNGARVSELARITRIPRPSLYRILETLCALGYLIRRDGEERYELTVMVRTLSDGFSDESWLSDIAKPVMEELQREIVWSTDIATFYANAMYLRATTRRHSPLTIDTLTVGLRLPMLESATGITYLAFCPDRERKLIIEALKQSGHEGDERAKDAAYVRNQIAMTRKNGYGERDEGIYKKTGAIAVPIRRGDQVLACLNISFIASALKPPQAAERYLGQLKAAAKLIEQRLEASAAEPGAAAGKRSGTVLVTL